MDKLKYFPKLMFELFEFSVVNRSFSFILLVLVLMFFSFVVFTAQVSAPFIYTLF